MVTHLRVELLMCEKHARHPQFRRWDTEAQGGVLPKSANIAALPAHPLPGLLAFLYQHLWAPW